LGRTGGRYPENGQAIKIQRKGKRTEGDRGKWKRKGVREGKVRSSGP
jgi:hypothetical protein